MTIFFEKNDGKYRIRSISLPNQSHPSTQRIEKELIKQQNREVLSTPTLNAICVDLVGLKELYNCMDDLLNLQSTREVLSNQENEKWVEEFLDGSIKLLDICSITRDNVLQVKECVRDLQSAIRRRRGDSSIETIIANFVCFRRKVKKDTKKLIGIMKKIDHKFETTCFLLETSSHLSTLIRVFREVSVKNISIFESLSSFLSESNVKQSRWSMVSKLMNKRVVACEEKITDFHEFENVDDTLCKLWKCLPSEESYVGKMQNALKSLETLETGIEAIENGLEDVFRRLIKTRTSLLNIISQ